MTKKALATWEPPQAEIKKIMESHWYIVRAVRWILPKAIEVGEWLNALKDKAPHGTWEPWVAEKLPMMGASTARMYMQLARYRPELEEHFGLPLALPDKEAEKKELAEGEIDKIPSIVEARKWIIQLNKAEEAAKPKKAKKKKQKTNKRVQVDAPDIATLVESELLPVIDAFVENEDQIEPIERVVAWDVILSHVQAKRDAAEEAMPLDTAVPQNEEGGEHANGDTE